MLDKNMLGIFKHVPEAAEKVTGGKDECAGTE